MTPNLAPRPARRARLSVTWIGLVAGIVLLLVNLLPAAPAQQIKTACARQSRDILYRLLQAPDQASGLGDAVAQLSPACALLNAPQALLSNVYFQAGNQAWQAQQWAIAASAYRQAIARDPSQAAPQRRLAEILLYEDKQPAAALTLLKQAQALDPHESYTSIVMAHAYAALNDPEQGLQAAQQALAVAKTPYGYMVQGQMLSALARWPEAIASFRASLALDDRAAETYLLLGNALQANGEPAAAEAAWNEAQRRNPALVAPTPTSVSPSGGKPGN